MKSVKGIYQNGQLTLEEEIPTDQPVEVVVVYDEQTTPKKTARRSVVSLPTSDIPLENPYQRFSREELY